jgi:hypothetical protein
MSIPTKVPTVVKQHLERIVFGCSLRILRSKHWKRSILTGPVNLTDQQ